MAFATRKFYKGSEAIDAIMNGRPLTKKQKEAKEKREQKEAEFHLKSTLFCMTRHTPLTSNMTAKKKFMKELVLPWIWKVTEFLLYITIYLHVITSDKKEAHK